MDYQNREREINLKSMFFAALYQWRKIVIIALILAIVCGGVKGVEDWRKANDAAVIANHEAAYQDAMDEYEKRKSALELQIKDLHADIDNQQAYLENSVLMAMDSRDFCSAMASFYISTDYEIMPGMDYQNPDNSSLILNSYLTILTNSSLLDDVAKDMGLEPQYLKELVTIFGNMDRMLTIEVRYKDQAGAQRIMELILNHLGEIQERVSVSIGEHTITEVMSTVGPDVDISLSDRQRKERDRLKKDMDELALAEEELEGLAEPQRTAVSRSEAVKSAIKFAVIGAVAGGFVSAVVACIWFVLTDKVQSDNELSERFGVRVLAVYPGARKHGTVDRWLKKMEGRESICAELADMLLVANVGLNATDDETILVTDWANGECAQRIAGCLRENVKAMKVTAGGSLRKDPAALAALRDCGGVVLVVQCKESRYSRVIKELDQIRSSGKHLIGCVILEK